MKILALDLSLTATGWADGDASGAIVPPKGCIGVRRLQWIRDQVIALVGRALVDVVVLEGYAYTRANQAHQIGEVGGVVRVALADNRVPFVDVAPTSLKMFATGKGNAPKDQMLADAVRVLGYQGHDHNQADALWLLTMAQCQYRVRVGTNAKQREALAKITWPAIAPATAAS